ncbi:unnamed protein product [Calypogeia fissa]
MSERPHVRYSKVSSREDDLREREMTDQRFSDRSHDLRYEFNMPETVPWKSVFLALFLLAFGTIFLIISHFMFTEHMGGDSSQAYGFLILGILIFLPGFYETRMAYYSWRGAKGYSWSSIPAYD